MDTNTFLQTHRVFNLDEATLALAPAGGRNVVLERLKYAASRGKVKNLARGVYATVPPGMDSAKFHPDRFLTAAALRPDAVFSHHSALELLGAAHSDWQLCTAYSARRSQSFDLGGIALRFLFHPQPLERRQAAALGTRSVRRLDRELTVTGPERTLIEGLRRPDLVGGFAELVESAAETGFRPETLDKVIRLGEIAADVGRHPLLSGVLALKGGTALNLIFGPPLRLSVDLDFNYVGNENQARMQEERPEVERALKA